MKSLIGLAEERFLSYRKMIEDVSKDKVSFPVDDGFVIWYKAFLRDNKNEEQKWLRKLVEEKRYENEGLNPPFCYPEYRNR